MVTPVHPSPADSALPQGGTLFSAASPPRLLLVVGDDEERRILGWTLEAAGAVVADAADVAQGLRGLVPNGADLVLVDAELVDAARMVDGAHATGTPVGVLGGTGQPAHPWLPRPYTWAELSDFVLRLCAPSPQAATSTDRLPGV